MATYECINCGEEYDEPGTRSQYITRACPGDCQEDAGVVGKPIRRYEKVTSTN